MAKRAIVREPSGFLKRSLLQALFRAQRIFTPEWIFTMKSSSSTSQELSRITGCSALLKKLQKQNQNLRKENEDLRIALEIVATGIQRDVKRNLCWLAGAAIHVHAIESALKKNKAQKSC